MENHPHISLDAAPPAETALTRFRAAQAAFVNAAVALDDAWDGVPGYASNAYPFAESFDEMLERIFRWKAATDREPIGNPRRRQTPRIDNRDEPERTWIGDVEWSCECGDGGPADFDLIDEAGEMIFGVAAVGDVHGDGTEPGALYRCGRCGLRVRNAARPAIGTRYRLRRDVDRFPHGEAPAGSVGTIVARDRDTIALRLDTPLAWLDEWDNGLLWHEEHAQHFYEDCEHLAVPAADPFATVPCAHVFGGTCDFCRDEDGGEEAPPAEVVDDEPCDCGEVGPHWLCAIRSVEAQRALEWTAATLANVLHVPYGDMESLDSDWSEAEMLLHDVALLMAERGLTGWTRGGFE